MRSPDSRVRSDFYTVRGLIIEDREPFFKADFTHPQVQDRATSAFESCLLDAQTLSNDSQYELKARHDDNLESRCVASRMPWRRSLSSRAPLPVRGLRHSLIVMHSTWTVGSFLRY